MVKRNTGIHVNATADLVVGEPRVSIDKMWDPTSTSQLQSTHTQKSRSQGQSLYIPIFPTLIYSNLPIEQTPPAMNATAIDSRIFRNLFGTEEARQIFSDEQYVSRMIDVETELARAQAKADVIPHDAADSITKSCNVAKIEYGFDLTVITYGSISLTIKSFEKLATDTDIVGYPVLPLVEQLTKMVTTEHAKYIHWGATTQDIQDSATMLQMKQGLILIRRQTVELISVLENLSHKHRDTYVGKKKT